MHTEIINISELANLLERSSSVRTNDLEGGRLYFLDLNGRDVRVTHAYGSEAVMFCSKADAHPVLRAISKPFPLLTLIQGGGALAHA
jgi:hypothetical protein